MNLVRNVILQKIVLSLLVQIILLQSLAYGMQIAERTQLDISVNSELLKACVVGDRLRVISLLEKGVDVNEKDSGGLTALHYATMYNHNEIAELLIKNGAEVNAKDSIGKTALHYAAKVEDLETAQNKPLEVSSQTSALLPQEIQIASVEEARVRFGEKYTRELNGLALDGAGLGSAEITASMVKTLEEELKCPMHQLFDCIVGTSFGGIVALGLVASEVSGCRLLATDDLVKFLDNTLRQRLPLRQRLNVLFKGSGLSDALTRVIVPCKKKDEAFDFDSREAKKREVEDYYIRDIALATCTETENEVTANTEYKNKAAELLFKKMESTLDENQRKNFHILYCSNAQSEGHNRVHTDLSEKLNRRYCRIKAGSWAAAENFLKENESFIRRLQENRLLKHQASL